VTLTRGIACRALMSLALIGLPAVAQSAGAEPAANEASADSTVSALAPTDDAASIADSGPEMTPPKKIVHKNGIEYLDPDLAEHRYALTPGPRPYANRLSFSPAYGNLGTGPLYSLRVAYNPTSWLGYEVSLGHNPGSATHAVLHMLSANLRVPFAGRTQPYATLGYGMITVFPGNADNTDPVSKNTLAIGGGLEYYIRNDLALRGEVRRDTVFGSQRDRDGLVVYDYLQETIGIAFYRSIRP
jgi:Outer membrane protein beta-barrel domain